MANTPNVEEMNVHARFAELERKFGLGDKLALLEVIDLSRTLKRELPLWAIEPLQDAVLDRWKLGKSKWKGETGQDFQYLAMLRRYVQTEVYRAAMKWVKDPNRYQDLPKTCIEAWFEDELKFTGTGEALALEIAVFGLESTFAKCSSETLIKNRYTGATSIGHKLTVDIDQNDKLKDFFKLPLTFGYREAEVLFGLRPPGPFWGTDATPPAHVQKLLNRPEPPMTMEDF